MPTTAHGRSSRKNKSNAHKPCEDGMLDMLACHDTGYPDLRSKRRFKGNGPTPPNPYGGRIATPTEKNK